MKNYIYIVFFVSKTKSIYIYLYIYIPPRELYIYRGFVPGVWDKNKKKKN